jgi:hypothetical protein
MDPVVSTLVSQRLVFLICFAITELSGGLRKGAGDIVFGFDCFQNVTDGISD